jgi:hypothetical protein
VTRDTSLTPARRDFLHEDAHRLALTNQQTSLPFDLMAAPNHKGHIIGPGEYQLDILVAADDVRPIKRIIATSLLDTWNAATKR